MMNTLKFILLVVLAGLGGHGFGWLTVNTVWFPVLSAFVVSVALVAAFVIWSANKFLD